MLKFSAQCKICKKPKVYKSKQGLMKCKDKPCRSCSNSLQRGGKGDVKPTDGYKKCAGCGVKKKLAAFHFYKDKGYYHSLCNVCKKEAFKLYQKTIGRFKKYNITKQKYDNLCRLQNFCCAICLEPIKTLYIDHNHKTNKIRGLLCRDCNLALGLFKDNSKILVNATNYLRGN